MSKNKKVTPDQADPEADANALVVAEDNAAPSPKTVRAKFQTSSVTSQSATAQMVNFQAVKRETADGDYENQAFAEGEIHGAISLLVTNPDMIDKFKAGSMYYVDFTEA